MICSDVIVKLYADINQCINDLLNFSTLNSSHLSIHLFKFKSDSSFFLMSESFTNFMFLHDCKGSSLQKKN